MGERLRFGLLGCGKIAERHASLLGGGLIAGAELVGVCDLDLSRAQALAQKQQVLGYSSIDQMMTDARPDVMCVLTPSGVHADNVMELAPYGIPIVVEKPMALTLSDADRMIDVCDRHGCRLFVVKQNRFNRPVLALRRALDEDRFGKLVMGTVRLRWCRTQSYYDSAAWRGTWQHDGGVLTNQTAHHIDLLEWMMGDVASVYAIGATALVDIECEDTAVVVLRFQNGALGVIEATTATRPKDLEGSLSVLGERGSVVVGGFAANKLETWNFQSATEQDATIFQDAGQNPEHPHGYAHHAYYDHVVDCIVHQKKQLVDGLEGRRSLELITAIYESMETGTEVKLRFNPQRCRLGLTP